MREGEVPEWRPVLLLGGAEGKEGRRIPLIVREKLVWKQEGRKAR